MSNSKICEIYNPYFKKGCQPWCLYQHLFEPAYIKYCTHMNTANPPTAEAKEAFATALRDFNEHRYKHAIEIVKNLLSDYPVNQMYHRNIARFYERIYPWLANFHFRKAIAIDPADHLLHVHYANYSSKQNDHKTASHHFRRALQLNENDSVTHGMYAKYLRDVEKNYAKSEYHFKCSLDLNQNDNRALYHYAILLHRMRKLKLSRHYFEQCLSKDLEIRNKKRPDMIWHHYEYALLLKDSNDFTNARLEFEYCLSLNNQKFVETSDINYEYGLLLSQMTQNKQIDVDNGNDMEECKYSESSSANSSSYSMPNHLEITKTKTKTRKTPRPPPPPPTAKTETERRSNVSASCEIEFERWLRNKIAINAHMGDMYLFKFKNFEYNDIRLLELFDKQTLNSVISNKLHIKMFEKQIKTFSQNMKKFVEWLKNIGVYSEYYDLLERKGILTFESFYHYINNPHDIELIIGTENKKDACYIWNATPKQTRRIEGTQTINE